MIKRIVIVGAGVVGTTSAARLAAEGHDVVLIERDPEVARETQERLDIQVIAGNGCSLSVLREADLDSADMLLAGTNSDEVNMITALLAGSQFRVDTKVVRLRSKEYLENLPELASGWHGRTFGISPDRVAADRIVSQLRVPHAVDVAEVLEHELVVAGFRIEDSCPLVGRALAELRSASPGENFLLASLYRGGEALRPTGETRLASGDIAYFSATPEDLPKIQRIMGFKQSRQQKLVVGGGGHIGKMVAEDAIKLGFTTVVIRRDRAEAEKLAIELPQALVLSGDITSEEILLEAGVDHGATFVGVTNSQEINLLSSVIVERLGAQRVITLIDSEAYASVAEALGIHSVVSPRLASVGEILRFVRGTHVQEVQSLPLEKVEVSSVEVDAASPLAGRPLREIPLPQGVLVAAVQTADGDVHVPGGETVIEPGSRAVLFTLAHATSAVEKFLE